MASAVREQRFRARAVRIDLTVIEADIKYPTDAGLAAQGVKAPAREGRKLVKAIGRAGVGVRGRSRSMDRRLRTITRTIRRRSGKAKGEVLNLTGQTGELLTRSVKEARRLAATARRRAPGRGAQAKLRAAARLDELTDRCEKVAEQIVKRVRGEKITNRLISLSDPDARPIRKGKLGKPTEFGYVAQLAEVTPNTKRGARGLILPAASLPRQSRRETRCCPRPSPSSRDSGSHRAKSRWRAASRSPQRPRRSRNSRPSACSSPGANSPAPHAPNDGYSATAPMPRGASATSTHGYGLRRSRLKGDDGQKTWTGWAILTYNLDTLTVRSA